MRYNMRGFYRKTISLIEELIIKIHIFKTWLFEWYSILTKSKRYKHIVWTNDQKREFDHFWQTNYGRKISTRWHKYYQSCNGVYDIRYFPEILLTTKLEPKLNSLQWCKVLSDKSLTELIYSGDGAIKVPKTIVLNCSGIYYDKNRSIISKEKAMQLIFDAGDIVIKPIRGESSGRGVRVLTIEQGRDTETSDRIEAILDTYKENYIVQERLRPNPQYARLYEYSINTVRIITYIVDGEVHHAPLYFRMGANGNKVDNIHAGGIGIGVSDDGKLNSIGYNDKKERFEKHPDTGVCFKGYVIPYTREIIATAYKAHGRTPHVGIVSWDFSVNIENEIVLIEANLLGQTYGSPQIVHGCPIFGSNTEDTIKLIR